MTKLVTDIALSSRIRLARNVFEYAFSHAMREDQKEELIKRVTEAINTNQDFICMRIAALTQRERKLLVERHLISPDLAAGAHGAALINRNETISIMIGEEDHLRIQCLLPGLQLEEADAICASLDHMLSKKLSYAFDPELGYLTACPTNIGSGMRASVMLHLSALSLAGQTEALLKEIGKLGYMVRGIYGEGSSAPGHIYQISNQMTLGILEEDIISNLKVMVQRVMEREQAVREALYKNSRLELEDIVYRSCGLLRYARKLSASEAMNHISNLKLGSGLGILSEENQLRLNGLLTDVQAASLEKRLGRTLDETQRDEARARIVREVLDDMNITQG